MQQERQQQPQTPRALPAQAEVRGVYLWGNHSPNMWPDVSHAEAKINGRWVHVEDVLRHDSEEGHAGEGSERDAALVATERLEAWRKWVSATLVPAVRGR